MREVNGAGFVAEDEPESFHRYGLGDNLATLVSPLTIAGFVFLAGPYDFGLFYVDAFHTQHLVLRHLVILAQARARLDYVVKDR